MRKLIVAGFIAIVSITGFTSCSNCKECSVEVMGTKVGGGNKLCGDELKQAQAAGMTCH